MKVDYLDLKSEAYELRSELLAAVGRVLDRAQYILGPEGESLEAAIAEKLGVPYVVAVNSGTDAIILSLLAASVGPGDQVITVSNSFFSTANAIKLVGAEPVFIDIGEDLLIDLRLLERAITSRTKAIIPVHLTGKPVDLSLLRDFAQLHKIAIIEDCAQAVGTKYNHQSVGISQFGAFSLHPLKNLSACGDGGFVTTSEKSAYETILKLRNHGLRNRDHLEIIGYNSRLDEIQAAILNVKLAHLDEVTQKRRSNAAHYYQKLEPLLGRGLLSIPREQHLGFSVYHTYVLRAKKRNELKSYLQSHDIETKIHYPSPIHLQPPYRYLNASLPITERCANEILSLPIHQGLSESQIDFVIEKIRDFYSS